MQLAILAGQRWLARQNRGKTLRHGQETQITEPSWQSIPLSKLFKWTSSTGILGIGRSWLRRWPTKSSGYNSWGESVARGQNANWPFWIFHTSCNSRDVFICIRLNFYMFINNIQTDILCKIFQPFLSYLYEQPFWHRQWSGIFDGVLERNIFGCLWKYNGSYPSVRIKQGHMGTWVVPTGYAPTCTHELH